LQTLENESELISKVLLNNDKQAFNKIVKYYQQAVRQYCRRLSAPDHSLADDIAQDTFIQAYKKLAMYQGTGKFQGWLFRIAYFQFLQIIRSKKKFEELPEDISIADNSEVTIQSRDLESSMSQLPTNERTCLTLQYSFGYTQQEISEILDMPLGTIKSHSKRGKERLTQLLNFPEKYKNDTKESNSNVA
jgi:RNA polymerase sigma-70 factor (ECF subfamily)